MDPVPRPSRDAAGPADAAPEADGPVIDPDGGPVADPRACSPLFDQDRFPIWRVTLSDGEWAALTDEFLNRVEREAAGLDINP
jgi:hypothetical protein